MLVTLVSDIQIGAVCCLSIRSTNLLYQLSEDRSRVTVKMWLHNFSSFWHCSSNFLEDKWAFLKIFSRVFKWFPIALSI